MAYSWRDPLAEMNADLAEAAAESDNKSRFADVEQQPSTELQLLVTKILNDLGGPATYVGDNDWLIDRWGLISVFPGGGATAGCRACLEHAVGADNEDHLRLMLVEFIRDSLEHRRKCQAVEKWVEAVIS